MKQQTNNSWNLRIRLLEDMEETDGHVDKLMTISAY